MLKEVALASGVLGTDMEDFINGDLKRACKQHLPNLENVITSEETIEAYSVFKHKISF